MWFVYMIKNLDNKLYVGVSSNPETRLKHHNKKWGPLFTKKGNFNIIFLEQYANLQLARKREVQIKKWSRKKKEHLVFLYQQGCDTKQDNLSLTFQSHKV